MNTLVELLAGRRKIIDKSLSSLTEATDIIGNLPDNAKISLHFGSNMNPWHVQNVKSREVVDYLTSNFKDYSGSATCISYEVSEGRGKRKGELNFSQHHIQGIVGNQKYLGYSFNEAKVTFTAPINLEQRSR
ncbi:MAG TPA: hypothetical protein VHA12_03425 [Candidatus Nanoarchaeia archaeon]|nr:hypothetical protein [Candidatus Nanoarchaeia archaeon]